MDSSTCCCGWELARRPTPFEEITHCPGCHAAEASFYASKENDPDFWVGVWSTADRLRRNLFRGADDELP